MKKCKKRGILCAIGAALFAVAIPQMDSSEPAEIVMAVVITLVLAFVAVRFLFSEPPSAQEKQGKHGSGCTPSARRFAAAAQLPGRQQTACGCPCAEAGLPTG